MFRETKMKMRLFVAVVLCTMAAPAVSQSTVTLYGVLD